MDSDKQDMNSMEAHIEAFIDGTLSDDLTQELEKKMQSDANFSRQVELAQEIKSSLSSSPSYSAPVGLEKAIMKDIKSRGRSRSREASGSVWRGLVSRPMGAVLQIACLVAIAVFVGTWIADDPIESEEYQFTQEEINQAEEDIKWVMAFVSETGLQTGEMVRDEVIAKRVVKPMKTRVKTSIMN